MQPHIGNLAASLVVAKLGTACLSPGELIAAGQHDFPDLHLSAALLKIAQWRGGRIANWFHKWVL